MDASKNVKYIFITGGVVSSLGKGILGSSLGLLLKQRGYRVSLMKLDPYLNVDPGTMSPFQHGEVYVTEDGVETDLDLGHYERFLDENTSELNSVTSGKIYSAVIEKERAGEYLGGTVQVIPHITNEIKNRIHKVADCSNSQIIIAEIGGTVGDIESLPFLEAIRQLGYEIGRENVCYLHLTLLPYIKSAGEMKTKPTQHSVMKFREIGIQPDFIICRTDRTLNKSLRGKIGLFCNVRNEHVIEARDADTIYEVPLKLQEEKLDLKVLESLALEKTDADLSKWIDFVHRIKSATLEITIAMCGKYVALQDAYKSISEAFIHAGVENNVKVSLAFIDTEKIEEFGVENLLNRVHGILIPGGFGERGLNGKLACIRYAREKNIPYFGICLGLQTAVIEFGRNVCGIPDATSEEFEPRAKNKLIHFMEKQSANLKKGGTMRLGAYPCHLLENSLALSVYNGEKNIQERHRHRFEINNNYREILEKNGMIFSGLSPDGKLVEIIELTRHPWFLACQFHPELKSRVTHAHPIFKAFVKAAIDYKEGLK
ncbi:CTP synthase [Candidatus Riflebacteria bacterium]